MEGLVVGVFVTIHEPATCAFEPHYCSRIGPGLVYNFLLIMLSPARGSMPMSSSPGREQEGVEPSIYVRRFPIALDSCIRCLRCFANMRFIVGDGLLLYGSGSDGQ